MQNFDEVYLIKNPVITPSSKKKAWLVLGGVIFSALILSGSFFLIQRILEPQETSASVSVPNKNLITQAQPTQMNLPSAPPRGVAGATDTAESNKSESTFSLVRNELAAPSVPQSHCQPTRIFQIGDQENDPNDPPADEFNWSGALDVLPTYPQPFIIGTHQDAEFPWRSDTHNALPIAIQFEYSGQTTPAQLLLSWSPGKASEQMVYVSLDNQSLGSTTQVEGSLAETGWEQLIFTSDVLPVMLTPGVHTLTLKPRANGGDAVVWDYLSLQSVCP